MKSSVCFYTPYQSFNHKDLPLNMQVDTNQIVRIRADFFFIANTTKFNLRYFRKPITHVLHSHVPQCFTRVIMCNSGAKTWARFDEDVWRRNKLLTNSMIIDIYYPMKLNWIEQEFELPDNIFQTSNIESCFIVVGSSTYYVACKMCFIVQIWHFWFIMRISVFTINLHASIK